VAGESITFDFLSRGADSLAQDFRKTGDNATIAAKGARLCADALEKQRKAADVSAGATIALAKADRILADAEEELAGRAALADEALRGQGDAAKKAGKNAAEAAGGVSTLAGTGGIPGGGMGAAIAAGVLLSPVLVTLGVGFAGLGAAAAGIAKPIADAASKTGGLRANLKSLDPEQQAVAKSILGLGKQYDQFQNALKPEILTIFNQGIKIAGGLLKDIQPVAAATGKAFSGFLGQLDKEFSSGQFQQFFKFMADTAGPDMKLLGDNIVNLIGLLPTLLEDLQPLAQGFLEASDNALKLAGSIANFGKSTDKTSNSVGTNVGLLGFLSKAVANVTSFMKPGGVYTGALNTALAGIPGNAGKAGDGLHATAVKAQSYAQWVAASAKATTDLANAQSAAVSTQLAYGNDILTSANDAQTFHDKLKASANQIGLHTQAQRDSFGAANTYIGDLARQATAAIQSGHGTDAAITAIRNGLPALDSAKTKNRQYWEEVRTLVSYLNKLELIKFINTPIHVTGTGKWSVTGTTITPGVAHGPQNIGAAPTSTGAATGLYINRGTGPTADDVMIRASRGELIVPANMVKAGAVDHLRGSIPGFAAGGVAGSYGPGKVSGLPPWISGRINATDTAIAQNTAQAILNAMASAQAQAKAAASAFNPFAGISGVPSGGPIGAGAAAAQAFAKSILWAYGWGAGQFPPLQALWNQESGWRWNALNPSSGAYGIPQSLPASKMASAGADWRTNPATQIRWGLGYIKGRYGSPAGAWAHERAYNWYSQGGLVPGFASGGTVGTQGAAWLKAWQTRHGGGYGAAWGPKVLQEQIPEMAAAVQRAKALSGASGLSPGQHRFWAAAAADETKRLAVLGKELTTERAWRTQLGLNELSLDKEIRAAGNLPSLAGAVRGWKAQLGQDKARVAAISKMLGYSDAYLAAHKPPPPGPVLPTVTHTYGGDVANNLGTILAAALGPFTGAARGGMVFDQGGTLRPGWNPVYNGTGRPESLVPARSSSGKLQIEWVGDNGSDELTRWIRKNVVIRGGGNVQKAFGAH
jgi:hypothetical protein